MKILVAGGTGFIGKELIKALSKNHDLIVLGRNRERLEQTFPHPSIHKLTWDILDGYDAKQVNTIINLSGSNIGAKRWNKAVKKEIIDSRVLTNQLLIEWLIKGKANPHYYSANAVGIYGAQSTDKYSFDENNPVYGQEGDFLKEVGLRWENSLKTAINYGIPVTTLRFGVVLKKGEGMLRKLELPFSLGLGSVLGKGSQYISWIHYEDLINAILFLLEHSEVTGPVNLTAPNPVSQRDFAIELAKVMKRPILLKIPSFLIKVLFGQMGEYLLLKGQKVIPKKLATLNFKFIYPKLQGALNKEYSKTNHSSYNK